MAKDKKVKRSCKVAKQPVLQQSSNKPPVYQNHHLVYENKEKRQKAVIRRVRKGVHRIVSLIRRYNFLTNQEVDTIKTESELKRKYDG